jgi:hypothetical protein
VGLPVSLILIAVGAILAFAVHQHGGPGAPTGGGYPRRRTVVQEEEPHAPPPPPGPPPP